ncbi:MAG: histidine triad nucleotide-binding protein [Clostridia bacterium]|nr:histidine triad nucleotide-binding protein [Clostridia bacterium]
MEDCLFCKIVVGSVPSEKVFENDYVLAFKDINPVAPVHVLIIPKIHIQDTNEISDKNVLYISEIYKSVEEIASICGVKEKGYRLVCNCGNDGGQMVHHLHFHLLGGKKLRDKVV